MPWMKMAEYAWNVASVFAVAEVVLAPVLPSAVQFAACSMVGAALMAGTLVLAADGGRGAGALLAVAPRGTDQGFVRVLGRTGWRRGHRQSAVSYYHWNGDRAGARPAIPSERRRVG